MKFRNDEDNITMSEYKDGERRDCLDCHGTLEYDAEEDMWFHVEYGPSGDCPRNRN